MGNIELPDEFLRKNWLLDIGGVQCNVYVGADGDQGPDEGHPTEGRKATVTFLCDYVDRLRLVAGLLGTVAYDAGVILRTPPFAYPVAAIDTQESDGVPGVFAGRTVCTAIAAIEGIKPFNDRDGSITGLAGWVAYAFALVTAEFSTPPYLTDSLPDAGGAFDDLMGLTYAVSKTKVSAEVLAPPTGALIYAEGAYATKPLADVTAGQVRVRYELSVTRIRMPIYPADTIDAMVGSVNAAAIPDSDDSIPRGAAMFMGANPEPRSDPYSGGIIYDIELVWLVNAETEDSAPTDWNYFLDPAGTWTKCTTKGGTSVFRYEDHNQLLGDEIA